MNSTESNRVKNRPSAPSAQLAGPAASPGRAPLPRPTPACRARLPADPTCACLPIPPSPACRSRLRLLQSLRPAKAQMGSSPFQVLHLQKKFFSSFFFSFCHWKIPKKNIYLFSFIFQYTNKFIKFFFLYILLIFFTI